MNQSSDDRRIRELFQSLKSSDRVQTPDFVDVLQRPMRAPDRRPARRLQIAVAFSAAATLLAALLITFSQRAGLTVESKPRIAQDSMPTVDHPPDEHVVDIDFEGFRATVDEHFALVQSPQWPTQTDSLLVVNLDISQIQE